MDQAFRIADIEVSRAESGERIVGLFRYDAEGKGRRGPTLLILADIDSSLYAYEQLLDTINEAAEQARIQLAKDAGDSMARFEKLVQKLNEAVAAFIEREPTAIAWNRINLYVMEFDDGHVCLTGLGQLANIFLQKQADGTWKGFDLFGSLEQPPEIDPKKPFASLMCGDMKIGDLLFAGTQNFEPLRNQLRLSETLKSLPPVAAALELRQELERRPEAEDYAGVVVWLAPLTKEEQVQAEQEGKSTRSIERMHRNEREADGVLSPAIRPPKPAATLVGLMADLKSRFKRKSDGQEDAVAVAGMRGMAAGHGSIMTVQRKRSLILLGILLALLAIGGIWFQRSQKAKAEQALWNSVYDQAADLKARAEGDSAFDEDRARALLAQSRELLNGLDDTTAERRAAKAKLASELGEVTNKLKRETTVQNPPEFASAGLGAPEGSLSTVAVYKGNLYATDASTSQLIEVKPASRETKRYALPTDAGRIVSAWPGQSALYLLTADQKMYSFNPTAGTVQGVSWTAGRVTSTAAFAVYGRRFYVLDPVGNMVWRYEPVSGGIGTETAYLKQNSANLASAVAVGVDQNVHIAFSDGSIRRYTSGAEDSSFKVYPIDPPVTSLSGLWLNDVSDRIVITDVTGKRIIVLRKDGRLVAQIKSPILTGPTGVHVDTEAKKIYVADNNKIYQFELP